MSTAAPTKPRPTPTGPELRCVAALELRASAEGTAKKLMGFTAPFNSLSQDFGGWKERIIPGAFARAIREKQDVRCKYDHTDVLGRISAGTLMLREEAKGLWFECAPPDTQAARDCIALVDRKDVTECSFSFRIHRNPDGTGGVRWVVDADGTEVRELLDVDLFDVGPVPEGAYAKTDVGYRSLVEARAADGLTTSASKAAAAMARLRLAEAG